MRPSVSVSPDLRSSSSESSDVVVASVVVVDSGVVVDVVVEDEGAEEDVGDAPVSTSGSLEPQAATKSTRARTSPMDRCMGYLQWSGFETVEFAKISHADAIPTQEQVTELPSDFEGDQSAHRPTTEAIQPIVLMTQDCLEVDGRQLFDRRPGGSTFLMRLSIAVG